MPPLENKKILVVEDVTNIEIDVKNRLEEMGYIVQSIVLSAEKAFESIENESPDIVLMDINLDGNISGIEAARQIQDNYSVPVLFLSGESDKKILRKTAEAGAYGFVSKPFKEAEIFANIEHALYKHDKYLDLLKENKKLKSASGNRKNTEEFIFIRADYKLNKINLKDILFIEAQKDYVVIHTAAKVFTTHATMKKMEKVLPEDEFMRIHRSYIIRLDKIFSVKYPDLVIEHKMKMLPVGGLYRKALFDNLNIV